MNVTVKPSLIPIPLYLPWARFVPAGGLAREGSAHCWPHMSRCWAGGFGAEAGCTVAKAYGLKKGTYRGYCCCHLLKQWTALSRSLLSIPLNAAEQHCTVLKSSAISLTCVDPNQRGATPTFPLIPFCTVGLLVSLSANLFFLCHISLLLPFFLFSISVVLLSDGQLVWTQLSHLMSFCCILGKWIRPKVSPIFVIIMKG